MVSAGTEVSEDFVAVERHVSAALWHGGPPQQQPHFVLTLARGTGHAPLRKHILWLLSHRETPSSISRGCKSEVALFCDPLSATRYLNGVLLPPHSL